MATSKTTETAFDLSATKAMGFACYCMFDVTKTTGIRSVGATLKQTRGWVFVCDKQEARQGRTLFRDS